MSRERRRAQVMLTSLALVGVVAVGAAAPPATASPARAAESVYVSPDRAVAVAEEADEGWGGSDEQPAVVVVTAPRGVTPVAVDKAPTVLPPDPTRPSPAWDAWEGYAAGDRVVHDGLVYEAVVAHRGSGDPGLIKDRAVWRIVSVV